MNVQGTDYLFPLEKVNYRFRGYFIDKEGQVYSTRGPGARLSRLAGSKQNSWSNRYYTLDGASWEHGHLIRQAKAHGDFAKETTAAIKTGPLGGSAVLSALQARASERSHAKTTDEAINSRGSIIASVIDGKFVFGSNPVVHTTAESVKSELARLAMQNPGIRYVEFKINATVVSGGLNWS